MRNLFFLSALILMAGCGSSGGGSSSVMAAATVQGTDYSGTYRLTGVQCYTSAGVPSVSSSMSGIGSTITVQGNALTKKDTTTPCILTTTGQIVFTASTNSVNVSNLQTTTSTGAACGETMTFSSQISPASLAVSYSNGQADAPVSATYVVDSSGDIGLFSTLQNIASATDLCFEVYSKL